MNLSIKSLFFSIYLIPLILFMDKTPSTANASRFIENCEKSYVSHSSSSDIVLTCNLRTLNNDFEKLNLSLLEAESVDSIVSLSLICSDVLFYQSSLGRLPFTRLGSLSIEHCKLSRLESGVFSSLGLKNLTIQTHNTAWPALSLDLSPGLFNSMSSTVERIDFSQNNIWTFPAQTFCPTKSLRYLNVSMNRLQDIHDLGFGSAETIKQTCSSSSVRILDMSYNRLILLPPFGISKLTQLKELYLQGNEISVVSSSALTSLKTLGILNLADNKLTTLPAKLFQDNSELTEIYLQNNSIEVFDTKLLKNLDQLVILDLSHNRLNTLESETGGLFGDLIRLVLLNLGYNQLSSIGPESFQNLYSLQILNLDHNQIIEIKANTFYTMNNLHTLILSHNQLTVIDGSSLNGLFVLSQLSLDNNNISTIDSPAFQNCSSLKDLNLNGNLLTSVGSAIQNLTQLKTLDLGENQLVECPLLVGLPALYGVRLTGNRIVSVNVSAFRELSSLKILNLARNSLRFVQPGSFDLNVNLQAVRLDGNYLDSIQGLFVNCVSLIWLNVSDNSLSYFDYAMIPGQLQWIDLHKNLLGELGNSEKRTDVRLQTLDASFNRISSIGNVNLPDSLEMIFLNDNLISSIEPHTFYKKSNLSRVDIFANQIETLELSSLRLAPISIDKPIPEMYLAGNPIICDCNSEWLQRINGLDHLRQHFKIMDLESIYCRIFDQMSGPQPIDGNIYEPQYDDQLLPNLHQNNSQLSSPNKYSVVPLMTVTKTQFLCPYTNHCFNLCQCCEYNACDCQQQCPLQCNCFNDDVWATNIVDCANNNLHKIPHIPMDASHLYLDGNQILKLTSHVLIARKNLIILHLNNSQIQSIANNSLNGLKRLQILRLQDNQLTQLTGNEFQDLTQLKELYLHNNQLYQINNHTFASNTQLEVLTLNNNRLKYFTFNILTHNSYLIDINLAHNPWTCQCQFLANVLPWLQSNVAKLNDPAGVNCRLNGKQFSLVYINATRCSDLNALSGTAVEASLEDSTMHIPIPILALIAAAAVCLFFCGLLVIILCRKRTSLSNWIRSKCGGQCCYDRSSLDEQDKLYDIYISYSLKDEGWVNQVLAAELEPAAYRLCLHYKFPVTAYNISDTIIEAVESSKRTILVISKNFIQNEWSRFEYKSALHSALRGGNSNGKKIIVAISLGELPTKDLDPDLRILLKSATILLANDKLFISKLKAALPEPRRRQPSFSNNSSRLTLQQLHSRTLQHHSHNNHQSNNYHQQQQQQQQHPHFAHTLHLQTLQQQKENGNNGLIVGMNGNYHNLMNGFISPTNATIAIGNLNQQPNSNSSNTSTLNFTNTSSSINSTTMMQQNMQGSGNANGNVAGGGGVVPLFIPPFPPPNRPPPPFPTTTTPRRPPPEVPPTPPSMWA